MLTHRRKLIDRRTNYRDARLFIIATEGEKTEQQYFEGFRSSRLKVHILPTGPNGRSDPQSVLDRLNQFRENYDLVDEDECWLIIDVDRWKPHRLDQVCKEAADSNFGLAVSNPCFELWLYLHISENDLREPEFEALIQTKRGNVSSAIEARLRDRLSSRGGYQKGRLNFAVFRPGIGDAVRRARKMDCAPNDRWPRVHPCTRVYRLVEKLLVLLPPDTR